MANPSYLAIIECHEAFRHAMRELIASIATGIASPALFRRRQRSDEAVRKGHPADGLGLGTSCAQRPYFVLAHALPDDVAISAPYFSNASGLLRITAIVRLLMGLGPQVFLGAHAEQLLKFAVDRSK